MRILSRYILIQYASNLLLGILLFTFILLLDRLFELVDLLINKGVGVGLTLRLLGLMLPSIVSLTLPVANLLSSLLTYGHLAETNEITAARASGLGPWSLVQPPLVIALVSVLFLIPFNTRWAPRAHSHFRNLYMQVLTRNPLIQLEEKVFTTVGEYHVYVEKKKKRTGQLLGVTIYRTPEGGAPMRIFAKEGRAILDPSRGVRLKLTEGHLREIDPRRPHRWYYTLFDTYTLTIPFTNSQEVSSRTLEEMESSELRQQMLDLQRQGLPTPLFGCEWHRRLALAMTPLLFVVLGIPLALRVKRGGRSIGFGLSLLVVVAYYALLMTGLSVGQRGMWPPVLAMWMGNVVVSLAAAYFSWRYFKQ